jgi:predicted dehydrogenase
LSKEQQCRTVIVGYGNAGRELQHPVLRELFGPNHPVLVVDPAPVREPLPGGRWVPDLAAAFEAIPDPAAPVFHVATPPATHADIVEDLVDRGARRIILEKPIADTLPDAYRIQRLGRRATILPVSVWLHSRVTERVEEIIASGAVGAVRSLHMEQSKPRFRRTLRSDSHRSALDVEMPHQVLLALALAGRTAQVVSAWDWPMEPWPDSLPSMGGATVRIAHPGGVTSTLVTDLTSPVRVRRLTVVGRRGRLVADYPVGREDDFGQIRVTGTPGRQVVADAPLTRFIATAYEYLTGVSGPAPRGDLALHVRCTEVLEQARAATRVSTRSLELTP